MDRISLSTTRFFETQLKIEDIRKLIDNPSNSEREAAEGMKYLLASISKGRDVSSLYPSVAKLVVTPNNEIKKMVYIFLVHYAEVEPEAALLAINTLKKELSNSNQLVRANALRTMSSIRVRIIAQLVSLAVKQGSKDTSPYVRKAAAHAVPKLVSLDPEQLPAMIEVLETLLGDNSTMVLGSAIAAFNEVCPENWTLINRNYRKFCGLLSDMDEWGQVAAIHMLTRYARVQFVDPDAEREAKKKAHLEHKAKPAQTDGESPESSDSEDDVMKSMSEPSLDPDHALLLKSSLPLLQSRNTSVVLAVASLYSYLSPRSEHIRITKALILALRTRKEARYVLLTGILTLVEKHPDMFRSHLSDFFVDNNDPVYVRKLKIDIITLLANEENIARILREFRIYVGQEDKDFVQATIQSIGRCAMRLPEVTEKCMHCLTSLIGTHSESAVAEAIVVIKKLLQVSQANASSQHNDNAESDVKIEGEEDSNKKLNGHHTKSKKPKFSDVIKHMAKLLDTVKNPQARASIAWIISEHASLLKKIAPDVLRKLAKSFPEEELIVKLQTLNLGVKLYLTNPEQTTLLFQYILNLAKYDISYDLRDRARVIRRIVFNTGEKAPILSSNALSLFITQKPVPSMDIIVPLDSDGQHFFPGSISSVLGHTAFGYRKVPTWATERTPTESRDPIKREWEQFAYSSVSGKPITSIAWNSMPAGMASPQGQQSMMGGGPPGAPRMPAQPVAAHTLAGFASREEYERNFWGDDDDDANGDDDTSSSGSSDSDDSDDSSDSDSSDGSDSSEDSSDDDDEEDLHKNADNSLFDTPAPSSSNGAHSQSQDILVPETAPETHYPNVEVQELGKDLLNNVEITPNAEDESFFN